MISIFIHPIEPFLEIELKFSMSSILRDKKKCTFSNFMREVK